MRWAAVLAAVLAAVAAIGLCGASQATPQVESAPKGQHASSAPKPRGQSLAPVAAPPVPPEPDARRDGKATQSGNRVELGSWPDWVIVAFTAFLAWLSWRQHVLEKRLAADTGDSINIAKQSADAATQAAIAMKSVADSMAVSVAQVTESVTASKSVARLQRVFGEAQLRAYVAVLIGGARFQHRPSNIRFEASPLMRNTGGTAARNIRWRVRCGVLPNPLPPDFRFPIPGHQGGSSLLPAGETFHMTCVMDDMIDDELVFPATAGMGHGFFVWGYVIYEDIFRRTHRTTFAQQIVFEPSGPMDQDWNYPPPFTRGIYLAKHNRAN